MTGRSGVRSTAAAQPSLQVSYAGAVYPAQEVARGAAFRLFSPEPAAGFQRHPDPGAAAGWHRFVHASEVAALPGGTPVEPTETPLTAPLSRARGWPEIHRSSQSPAGRDDPVLAAIRRTATVRRGTRMVKVLSAAQLAGHLRGWLPSGFCYREYDIAHLRTPEDLALLRTDASTGSDSALAFVLRWRAVDPLDYAVPAGDVHRGLAELAPRDRVGPPVLGTGFAPSERQLIPEFVTAELTDLPLTANAQLVGYTPSGEEVLLYAYQPEQRGWLRMAGARHRDLLSGIAGVPAEQEYLPVGETPRASTLVGWLDGREYEAVADPPDEFRVLAMTRAARYPVETVSRRGEYASWRGATCQVLRHEAGWARLRLCRPDPDSVQRLAATCYERGIYEAWAPAGDLTGHRVVDVEYPG